MLVGFDGSRAFGKENTGTENYSLNLLLALSKVDRKNKYRVYLRSRQSGGNRKWPSNFEFKLVRPSRLWTQLGLAWETWKNPVDVLFVPAHTLPLLGNPKVKKVVTIHDLGVEFLPGYHKFPQRYYLDLASKFAAKASQAIIAVSKATRSDLINWYGIDSRKISVVYEGVERGFFRPVGQKEIARVKAKYKTGGNYILFVGTVQPRKNLEILIAAFAKALGRDHSSGRKFSLIIAGKLGWDYQKILDLPKKLGIGDRVKFLGYVNYADLPSLYTGASAFAFPSLFEGFGLPILESLSCGTLVLVSDIGSHREILGLSKVKIDKSQLEVPGVLIKANDVDEWVSFLYQTITKYDNRSTLISKRRKLASKFSWEGAAKGTIEVFQSVNKVK